MAQSMVIEVPDGGAGTGNRLPSDGDTILPDEHKDPGVCKISCSSYQSTDLRTVNIEDDALDRILGCSMNPLNNYLCDEVLALLKKVTEITSFLSGSKWYTIANS